MNKRYGFTLIELLLVMSVGSTIMLVSIGLVHRTLTNVSEAVDRSENLLAWNRLVRSVRADVHAAIDAQVSASGDLKLEIPDDRDVNYHSKINLTTVEQSAADGRSRRDSFAFLKDTEIRFEKLDSPARISVAAVRTSQATGDQTVIDRRVEVSLGRMRAMEKGGINE